MAGCGLMGLPRALPDDGAPPGRTRTDVDLPLDPTRDRPGRSPTGSSDFPCKGALGEENVSNGAPRFKESHSGNDEANYQEKGETFAEEALCQALAEEEDLEAEEVDQEAFDQEAVDEEKVDQAAQDGQAFDEEASYQAEQDGQA